MLRRALRSAPFVLALAALVSAAPAQAGGKKWHHHKNHGHHRCNDHGHGHGSYWAPRRVVEHRYVYPVYHYAAAPGYYCGPCAHAFDSYDHLSYHVHSHHHVAALELPSVIFQASIGGGVGWVFGDY